MSKIENVFREIYDTSYYKEPTKYPLIDFPLHIDIELTNHCNLKCIFCGNQEMKRTKGFMDFSVFKEVVDQGKEAGVKGIRFIRWGEAFLHKDVFKMMRYVKENGLYLHITTNGTLLNKENIEQILDIGVNTVIISLQGVDEKGYNQMRNTNLYKQVERGIINLVTERNKKNLERPFVQVTTTILDETLEQVKKWKNGWKKIVEEASWGYTWFGHLGNTEGVKHLFHKRRSLPRKFACYEVFMLMGIDWDGDVTLCGIDYDKELIIGNVMRDKLKELWKSTLAESIRTIVAKNKRQDLLKRCSRCEQNHAFIGDAKEIFKEG